MFKKNNLVIDDLSILSLMTDYLEGNDKIDWNTM